MANDLFHKEAQIATKLEDAKSAITDAGSVSGVLWLSYLFVLFYLFVAAAAISHVDLLLENPVRLPFLGIDLPLKTFFWLSPLLFLVVHTYVLIHFVLLANKVEAFNTSLQYQVTTPGLSDLVRRGLPINIFVQVLAGPAEVRGGLLGALLLAIAVLSLVIGPVALLLFLQLQFLPYHSESASWWQRISVLLDMAAIWTLWPAIMTGKSISEALGNMRSGKRRAMAVSVIGSLIVLIIVFSVAVFPGEFLGRLMADVPFKRWLVSDAGAPWTDHIIARNVDLIDKARFPTPADVAGSRETVSLSGRHLEEADLAGADLRKANFSKADLELAILTEAHVEGADFRGADLRGVYASSVHAQGAKFDQAKLDFARFWQGEFQGASFNSARMRGASLGSAHLEAADLAASQLMASDFEQADFSGATLAGAYLQGAMLLSARFDVTRLKGACLWQAAVDLNMLSASGFGDARYDPGSTDYADCDIAAETPNELEAGQVHFLRSGEKLDDGVLKAIASIRPDALKIGIPSELLATANAKENFDEYLSEEWKVLGRVGCSRIGAPYVVQGILSSRGSLFPDNIFWIKLANAWNDCHAVDSMDPSLRAIVDDYRNRGG